MLLKGGIIKTVLSLIFLSPMSCNIHVNQEKESHYGQLLILTQFLPRNTQDARSTGRFSGDDEEEEQDPKFPHTHDHATMWPVMTNVTRYD